MTEVEREKLALDLFSALCDEPPDRRAALLAERCGADAGLRQQVEELLSADSGGMDAAADNFLQAAVADRPAPVPAADLNGSEFDRPATTYRILRIVGEGGMGTVYEAEQMNPRRRVAIKAIRDDLRTPAALKRFEAEAQTLARLEHPGIARLYEADARPEEGHIRAYLAMEFVDGLPLDEYVAAGKFDTTAVLELFLAICEPVAYAHRRGVIHRDLKPGNILVTAEGQPKVLDFGVARTLDDNDTRHDTRLTFAGQIVGTLSYMSPEQLDGQAAADARADVYALGVILYQMLSGQMPIDTRTGGLAQAARRVLTEVPAPLGRLDRRLRGDLEAIVAKALEKDPDRRYPSVPALITEIRRFRQGLPIEARGTALGYRLTRAAWRYRRRLAAAAVLAVGVAGFLAVEVSRARTRRDSEAETRRMAADADRTRADAAAARDASLRVRRAHYEAAVIVARVAINEGDRATARRALDGCSPEVRGWEWGILDAMTDRSAFSRQHAVRGDVLSIATDGRDTVMFGYKDGGYDVVRVSDGRVLLTGRIDLAVSQCAVSPDGRYVAAQSVRQLAVRSVSDATQDWSVSYVPPTPAAGAMLPAFSGDGNHVVWSKQDGSVTVSRSGGGAVLGGFTEKVPGVRHMVVMPDGKSVLVGTQDARVRLLDLTGVPLREFGRLNRDIQHVAVSRDGSAVAARSPSGPIVVWDAATGVERGRVGEGFDDARSLAFAGDEGTLVCGATDGVLRAFSLNGESGKWLGHEQRVLCAEPSAGVGGHLISASVDGVIKRWTLPLGPSGRTVPTGDGRPGSMALVPGEFSRVILANASGLTEWDTTIGKPTKAFLDAGAAATGLSAVAIDRTSKLVAATGRGGVARVWDRGTGNVVARLETPPVSHPVLAFAPDGRHLLLATPNGAIRVVGLEPARVIVDQTVAFGLPEPFYRRSGDPYAVRAMRFSPDGSRLATVGNDAHVRLWSWPDLKPVAAIPVGVALVDDVLFSGDGRHFAAVTGLLIAVYDTASLRQTHLFRAGQGSVSSAAFHPDSNRLAAGTSQNRIRIWSLESSADLLVIETGRGQNRALAFTSDGSALKSLGADGTLRIWDSGR